MEAAVPSTKEPHISKLSLEQLIDLLEKKPGRADLYIRRIEEIARGESDEAEEALTFLVVSLKDEDYRKWRGQIVQCLHRSAPQHVPFGWILVHDYFKELSHQGKRAAVKAMVKVGLPARLKPRLDALASAMWKSAKEDGRRPEHELFRLMKKITFM